MTIQECIKKIDRYLKSEKGEPLIVDVNNNVDMEAIITHYHVGSNKLLSAASLCNRDNLPQIDTVTNLICNETGSVFVHGISPFLFLEGEQKTRKILKGLLSLSINGHVVILTYQCAKFFDDFIRMDVRFKNRICEVDGEKTPLPNLVFVSKSLGVVKNPANGINKLSEIVESGASGDIYICTSKSKKDYLVSLYTISEMKSAYMVLSQLDAATKSLDSGIGTEKQWAYALGKVTEHKSWYSFFASEFGNAEALDFAITSFKDFSEEKKWVYFAALKMYGAKNNGCLNNAAKNADSVASIIRHIYRDILDVEPESVEFEKYYNERKQLLTALENPVDETVAFCNILPSKGKKALYYLTDNTQKERELVFKLLDRYGAEFDRKTLENLLKKIYPDLYLYLQPYHFNHELLRSYFQEYKYQKIVNKVFPGFEAIVSEQAIRRDYNAILQPRSSVIETIITDKAQAFFVDAMGVEYLGYIMEKCHKLDLMANVTVCRSELPSITSRNKEFLSYFESNDVPVASIKDLDEIKHHGKDDFNYEKTKLPIHLTRELDVIAELLDKIKSNLVSGKYDKAILVADHGASRLAVIHETENKWEMTSAGKHSGRCCPKSELDEQPDFAADAEDFWALANYDRFIGGRKANVEVHGGATLEEVVVPIIEITYLTGHVEAAIMPVDAVASSGIPQIAVSYKKKAAIKLYLTQELQNVTASINDSIYEAEPLGGGFYRIDMPDIKKAGTYLVDIFACGNRIATGLKLKVVKESGGVRDIL